MALITGVTGQDGAYLAELLLAKGHEVNGIKRRASSFNTSRIDPLYQDPHVEHRRFVPHYGDMTDSCIYPRVCPQPIKEGYLLTGPLEATNELYGLVQEVPQKETTPFYPRSPYAVAKLYAYWITVNYREAYGLYACNGILFNHESPLRGETFVTRKITRALARIALGLQDCLYLGNLSALRDWGHARDYVEMMWLMLQQERPEDFVIATGVQVSVREFVQRAAAELGITVSFSGDGEREVGIIATVAGDKAKCKPGDFIVRVDPRYFRPTEVETLLGDATKARTSLGWTPKIRLAELVIEMVHADYIAASRDELITRAGYRAFDFHE